VIYLGIKAFHIVAVIAWMAGLFYLPRLFVYHVGQAAGSAPDVLFKTMERRLLAAIMRPAALATLASGVSLVWFGDLWLQQWLWFKLVGVLGLFAFHGMLEGHARRFARGERRHSERYFRIINEVPTVVLIWIVIFVVFQPVVF
jgi:protoporphyrinogen IX oxidase